jgi:hypothetical protein
MLRKINSLLRQKIRQVLKQIKEHETKLMQDAKERIENKQFIQNLLLTRAGSEKTGAKI